MNEWVGNMTDEDVKRPFFSVWQTTVISVLLLLALGYSAIKLMGQVPAQALMIDDKNITPIELTSLQDTLEPLKQVQFFSADLNRIHDVVARLSWVESVQIQRNWYQGVVVSVTPRRAVANFGSQQMLDANGVVFVPANAKQLMDKKLVTLYGDQEKSKDIMRQMQHINTWFAPLGLHVQDLVLTSRQTWVAKFNNGMRVVVDHENTEQKLYSLSKILKGQFEKQLPQIQSVDLRYKNGFAITWRTKR